MKKTMIFIIILILSLKNINAATIKLYDDGYKTKDNWVIKRIMIDNKLTYCVQPGVVAAINEYTKKNFIESYNKISKTKKELINKLGVYGEYYYTKENKKEYYYAAQELIWDQLSSKTHRFTKNLSAYRTKINAQVTNFTKLPITNNKTYTLKANTKTEYKDSLFEFMSITNKTDFEAKTGLQVTLLKDRITIENPLNNKKQLSYNLTLEKYKNSFVKGTSLAYTNATYQDYVQTKLSSTITMKTTFISKMAIGSFEVKKTNINGIGLKDAVFALYKDNVFIKNVTSDVDGFIKEENLEIGNYKLKEVQAPNNYQLDNQDYNFVIENNKTTIVPNIINKSETGKIKILKEKEIDLSTQTKPMKNVEFSIYKNNTLVEKIITNDEGVALSQDLDVGVYQVKESKTDDNYEIDKKIYDISVVANTQISLNQNKPIINKLKKCQIKINKVDEQNKPISGVEFSILNQDKSEYQKVVSNLNGVVQINDLPCTKYYLQETKTKPQYELNQQPLLIETIYQKQQEYKVVNKKKTFELVIEKRDQDTKELIDDVSFKLKNNIKEINEKTTKGIIKFNELEYGCYEISEEKAAKGYVKSQLKEQVCFNNVAHTKKIYYNKKVQDNNLLLYKLDKYTSVPLDETTFEIKNALTKKVIEKKTNKSGFILVKLEKGCYNIKEIKAKPGYIKSSVSEKVCLNNTLVKETFYNEKLIKVNVGLKSNSTMPVLFILLGVLSFRLYSKLFL